MLQMWWIFSFVQQYHQTLEAYLEMIQTSQTNIITYYVQYWTVRTYKTILLFVKNNFTFFFFFFTRTILFEAWNPGKDIMRNDCLTTSSLPNSNSEKEILRVQCYIPILGHTKIICLSYDSLRRTQDYPSGTLPKILNLNLIIG